MGDSKVDQSIPKEYSYTMSYVKGGKIHVRNIKVKSSYKKKDNKKKPGPRALPELNKTIIRKVRDLDDAVVLQRILDILN